MFVENSKRAYSLGASTTFPLAKPGGHTEEEYAYDAVYLKSAREESATGFPSRDSGALGSRYLDRGASREAPGGLGRAVRFLPPQ